MSIGRTDLNLLKVFEAVYEERNLLLAGKRLNLTQSAVSHALRRLRELVGDELFMRTGKGMVPTGRACCRSWPSPFRPEAAQRSPLSPCPLFTFVFAFLRVSPDSDLPTSSDSLTRPVATRRTYRLSVPVSISSRFAARFLPPTVFRFAPLARFRVVFPALAPLRFAM